MADEHSLNADISSLQQDISALQQKLNHKKYFEAALQECGIKMQTAAARGTLVGTTATFETFFKRARTLLRSRYSNPAFWAALQGLARSAQGLSSGEGLSKLLHDIQEECAQRQGDTPAEPNRNGFLFEGQLSEVTSAEEASARHGAENVQQELQLAAERIAEAVAAARQQNGGDQASNEELEAQAIMDLLQAQDGPPAARKPPKAGRRAMKQLQVIDPIDAEGLEQLGGAESTCSICREAFELGSAAQIMPCSHAHCFHPECLKPWMQENNSCPICRFELETDDADYEYQKAKEKQRAEDDKGAANAHSHNEFIYI